MRARYSAFALGDSAYLLASWHPDVRPASLELDSELRWYRLGNEISDRQWSDVLGVLRTQINAEGADSNSDALLDLRLVSAI